MVIILGQKGTWVLYIYIYLIESKSANRLVFLGQYPIWKGDCPIPVQESFLFIHSLAACRVWGGGCILIYWTTARQYDSTHKLEMLSFNTDSRPNLILRCSTSWRKDDKKGRLPRLQSSGWSPMTPLRLALLMRGTTDASVFIL